MDDPKWRRGYALLGRHGLSFDLQTPWWHLDAAADLARDFAATQIVINHTALPADRSPEGLAGWRKGLETAAARPNVALKISGLGRPGLPWTMDSLGADYRPAPLLGQHTHEVLTKLLGVTEAEYARFEADGVLA